MEKKIREWKRTVKREFGVNPMIELSRNHTKTIIVIAGRVLRFTHASTPSCSRAYSNQLAFMRRTVKSVSNDN